MVQASRFLAARLWKLTSLRTLFVLACVPGLFLAGFRATAYGQAQELTPQFHVKLNMVSPNPILAVDLVDSPSPEIVLTDVSGRLKVYDTRSGSEIGTETFGDVHLTAPVVGDFTGNQMLDLAFGAGTGEVMIVNGRNLRLIASYRAEVAFTVQPTIVTMEETGRDRLVLADQDGVVWAFDLDDGGTLALAWKYSTGSRVQAPIAVGNVRQMGVTDLVATTTYGTVVLIDPATGTGEPIIVQELTALPVSPLLADLNGDGLDEVVVSLANGLMRCLSWDPRAKPMLQPVWELAIPSAPVSAPTLLTRPGEPGRGVILQVSESSIQVLDRSGRVIAQNISDFIGSNTRAALIPRPGAYPDVAFGLRRTLQVTTNMDEWIASSGVQPLRVREAKLHHQLSHTTVTVLPESSRSYVVLGHSPDQGSHLYAFDTGIAARPEDWPTRSPWMTLGGSPYHNSLLDESWAGREWAIRGAMREQERVWNNQLQRAVEEENWDRASELAGELVAFNPHNPEYRSKRWEIWRKKYFWEIVATTLLSLAVIGVTSWQTTVALHLRKLRKRAEQAVGRGDYDDARRYYQRLLAKRPRNVRTAYALARVLVTQRDFSAETIDVYRKACAAHPEDHELLNALARALVRVPQTDDEALDVYQRALPSFPEPALLEYGIGRCALARGEYEEAGKRLRSALRGGVATDELYHSLCEVYLRTNNHTSRALPVYQQQFPARKGEREFLEAYLGACIDAKKMDQQVESLCQAVLDVSPKHIPAFLQLARIYMQKKQLGAAADEVKNALAVEAHNSEALILLAQCYMVQNRRDEDAVKAYRRALEATPEDEDLLRTLSSIYFEMGRFDDEAVDIYRRARKAIPGDLTTLRALARTAQETGDHDLAIEAIEDLMRAGQTNQALVVQLADAYVAREVCEPHTERVLREALRTAGNSNSYVTALARVLCKEERTDLDSLPIFEAYLEQNPDDLDAGRQLARAYINNNRYEQALKTTQRFLANAPEDEELQRLNALASLYDNRIDVAVSEYQRLLERNPDDAEALVNLALAYGQKMRVDDEARILYEKALRIEPGNDMLLLAMARVHASNSDAAGAVTAYRKALGAAENNEQKVIAHMISLLSERPDMLRIRWFLTELLVAHGHLREALEQIDFIHRNHPGQTANNLKAMETILKKDPKNLAALAQQGNLLLSSGQSAEAARVLERALQLQPAAPNVQGLLIQAYQDMLSAKDSPEVRFKLGRIFHSQQEYDQAIGCFQKTAQDYRWEAESTKMLGKCFTGKGMLDLALQEFKKLVVDEETKELLYDLAQRYETKRDLVGAKTVYRQLFAADIDYKDVKTRFEMLSGSTSDPMAFEKTAIVQQMSEEAARRYELLDELGRGAMGIVYRARDKELEEIVALKILPDNMSNNPEAVRRFKIEARNARKLSHPNIVRIHDIGEEMGRKYISMEYVDGTDLKRKMKSAPDRRLPLEEVVKYAMQIADALGYAHRLGIVHRDIKPANIMLTSSDDVKVTDFGIAKMMDSTGEGTMIGAVIGTPLYMSPEQVQGVPVDNRADIYSFGILLYELFKGTPPFVEGDLAYQHIHREPDPIEGLAEPVWNILSQCLAKKREDRWEKAEQIYDALREFSRA